jgi:hypothetical protein
MIRPLPDWEILTRILSHVRKRIKLIVEPRHVRAPVWRVGYSQSFARISAWEKRFSELAAYQQKNGYCNVPKGGRDSETAKLANWVGTQRSHYAKQLNGFFSPMTALQIVKLEDLGFKWSANSISAWDAKWSELAAYQKKNGHCNVPKGVSETAHLADWVAEQKFQRKSQMTPARILKLESLSFMWRIGAGNHNSPAPNDIQKKRGVETCQDAPIAKRLKLN